MNKIIPFLWFSEKSKEAADFYLSVFKDGAVSYSDQTMTLFNLKGQEFMALNGGPIYKFNEAISLFVSCDDQKEVDYYWQALTADGGAPGQCGWLKDKFGVSWQVIPQKQMMTYLAGPDKEGCNRARAAMFKMTKIDIDGLRQAYNGA